MTYTAVYEREKDGRWTVEIPSVPGCHSYGRTIDQARDRIREALSLYVDDAAKATIVDDVRLNAGALAAVTLMRRMRRELEEIGAKLPKIEKTAVLKLRKTMKLGHRDAGEILGLSFQRIYQIEKTRTPKRPRRRFTRRTTVTT